MLVDSTGGGNVRVSNNNNNNNNNNVRVWKNRGFEAFEGIFKDLLNTAEVKKGGGGEGIK